MKLLCYIEMLLYPGCKNNKLQRNFELWDQENYFVILGFCYISVLYNESPLYCIDEYTWEAAIVDYCDTDNQYIAMKYLIWQSWF